MSMSARLCNINLGLIMAIKTCQCQSRLDIMKQGMMLSGLPLLFLSPLSFLGAPTNLTHEHQKITYFGIILVDIGEFAIACLHYRKHYRNYVFYIGFLRRKNRLPSGRSTDHALANLLMALSQISVFCAAANNKRSERKICRTTTAAP